MGCGAWADEPDPMTRNRADRWTVRLRWATSLDLQQLHMWDDGWAGKESWQRAIDDLKAQKLIRGFGISVNRWEPANVLKALRTGLVDSVQVVYNIFDQNPEDELFPVCRALNVEVIARVPFDEGGLTGTLRPDSTWPSGDWRSIYFTPAHIAETLARMERLAPLLPEGMDLPELALRFVLASPSVSTVIPGMRKTHHVERNLSISDGIPLKPALQHALRSHCWERTSDIP